VYSNPPGLKIVQLLAMCSLDGWWSERDLLPLTYCTTTPNYLPTQPSSGRQLLNAENRFAIHWNCWNCFMEKMTGQRPAFNDCNLYLSKLTIAIMYE